MEITWQEIAKGFAAQTYFSHSYSDLYHALYRWLTAAAEAQRDALPLSAAQQAFVNLIEESWENRSVRGSVEASLLVPAAIHAAVLAEDASAIRRFYATTGGHFDPHRDTLALEQALGEVVQNPGEILGWFLQEGRVQTNEISRAITWLVPAYLFSAWSPDLTISMVELGTSAGLLLTADYQNWQWEVDDTHTYRINGTPPLMQQRIFSPDGLLSEYYQAGQLPRLPITTRVGFDLHPLDMHIEADVLRLEACIWGDQPERLHRLRHALQGYHRMEQNGQTVKLYQGSIMDSIPLIPKLLPTTAPHLLIVYNSAVTVYMDDWQYEQMRTAMMDMLTTLPAGVVGVWLENESPRHNESTDHDKFFLLKARVPFFGGMSTVYLAEQEAHPMNLHLRGGWDSLRGILGL